MAYPCPSIPVLPGFAALAAALVLSLAGCGGDGAPPETASGPPAASEEAVAALADAGFDQWDSARLLAEAEAAEAAGRPQAALDLYREAGLTWPDNAVAWDGLREVAEAGGREQEAQAAAFMAERVRLYPSEALFVQRDVNRALRTFVAAGRAEPDVNTQQLAYAERLADFYDSRYATRGTHEPLDPAFNLEPEEYPTAILTGGGAAIYLGGLFVGD